MRWRRLRWFVLALALISFAGILYTLRTSLTAQKAADVGPSALEGMLPEAVQWMQNFHRVEIQDGRKAWEIEAEEAQYLEDAGRVLVRKPRASFFLKEGDKVVVEGDDGILDFNGRDLQRVTLKSNVQVHVRGFVIRVDGARYDRTRNRIVAGGPVTIDGEEITIRGRGMVVFMKDARFAIKEQVHVTLLPRTEGAKRTS